MRAAPMRLAFVFLPVVLARLDIIFTCVLPPDGSPGMGITGKNGYAPLHKIGKVENQGNTPLTGAKIYYTGDTYNTKIQYAVPDVQPGQIVKVNLILKADHWVRIKDVPPVTSFKLVDAAGNLLGTFSGTVDIAWLQGALKAPLFDPTAFGLRTFNVLLFGQAGAGKSSFYNSILRMLQSQNDGFAGVNVEPTLGGQEHVTVTLKRLKCGELPLALWDTYGLAHDTWQGNELEMLMNGTLPKSWHKDANISMVKADAIAEPKHRPHAVLIFVTAAELGDRESAFLQNFKKQVVNIVRQGINPLVVVTKLDLSESCLAENWACAPTYKEQVIKAAHAALGVPQGNIYPVVNYVDFERKNLEIDRTLHVIIHRALSMAQQGLQQEEAKRQAEVRAAIEELWEKVTSGFKSYAMTPLLALIVMYFLLKQRSGAQLRAQ